MEVMDSQLIMQSIISSVKLLLVISYVIDSCLTISNEEIENHLEMGRQMLSRGQYSDALSHYHMAVEADPNNYLTIFKRATVYLALGKHKAALDDLNEVIVLKPDFLAARLQRGSVLLKQGRLDESHIDYEWVLRLEPYNEEAVHSYSMIEPLKHDIQTAYLLIEDHDWPQAVELLTRLLHELPWDCKLREMRSMAYEKLGDIVNAISDLRATTKMRSDNTDGYLKISKLHYDLGEADESLNTIRECLKLDPDHKLCFNHYKKVKKLAAQVKTMNEFALEGQYNDCSDKAKLALKTESENPNMIHMIKSKMCHCLTKGGDANEAITVCSEALKLYPEDVNVLCDRADAYLNNEDYERALNDFKRAHQIDEHSSRAEEGIKRTQKLEKQSKKRDYYKILGVPRNANKREITKAYRRLAMQWHPDQYQGDEKKMAEKKFIDIASAKEVLTDPEKRQKFDNGEDPLDAEAQANAGSHGFNPFGNGFNPFGGSNGGYSFKFTYG
ncbi:dnaJ homolog subfamily C member 3-like [Oppia nitens]|uniref:dnaJ homolog subfamily C member 3-like n=1 Tax=Oppia nitens TaxID=1686743 RepID=UPI0023DBF6D4|nr:dnaJ homolog subfamily C member 3-like [Oppia nitens]